MNTGEHVGARRGRGISGDGSGDDTPRKCRHMIGVLQVIRVGYEGVVNKPLSLVPESHGQRRNVSAVMRVLVGVVAEWQFVGSFVTRSWRVRESVGGLPPLQSRHQ